MSVLRLPVTIEIDEDGLAALLRGLGRSGTGSERTGEVPNREGDAIELPSYWKQVDEQHGVSYTWGEHQDIFDPLVVYEGQTSRGTERLAIGKCERVQVYGRDRIYYIVVAIGRAGGLRAISEFLATDSYEDNGEVIAIIKGKEGSGRQFDAQDELPAVYVPWPVVTYRDRVDFPGSYTKQALVCSELDHELMLNHALAQIQLRNLFKT
jgi:hypothetical protein